MNYPTTLIITALACSTAAAGPEQMTCDSPCDCHDAYGEGRWSVKTDASLPPTDACAIQAVTPSELFSWAVPDAALTMQSNGQRLRGLVCSDPPGDAVSPKSSRLIWKN